MNILVLAVGKVREEAISHMCGDYLERIRRCGGRISVEEVRDEPGKRAPRLIVQKEAGRLRSRLPDGAYTIALDPEGESCDSPGLAERLDRLSGQGVKQIVFILGGHLGLEKSLVSSCNRALSLSRMTFTHEMARLILLEQLYRAGTILRGEPYHK